MRHRYVYHNISSVKGSINHRNPWFIISLMIKQDELFDSELDYVLSYTIAEDHRTNTIVLVIFIDLDDEQDALFHLLTDKKYKGYIVSP